MTKKKTKKNQKANASSAGPSEVQKKEKEDDMEILEDFKRDEDLYISESDVTNISNFIRTTNKSFISLGNTVVEKFSGRCSLAILHALIALFDLDNKDRDDVIRRLNIIYIVWRLPELEAELRSKPQKNINDVYCHPFSTFLFYAEQMEEHVVESTLARIIVTNNVGSVEKLTAPDFIQKAASLNLHKVDRESWEKWEEANTEHWPEITEEMVSLSKAMRELGCERKDHEAGMAEAFYPLVHNPPTLLPPRMMCLEQEDPVILKYRAKVDPENKSAVNVIYSMSAGADMQEKLKQAFADLEPTVVEYQSEIFSGMTAAELEEAQRVVTFDGRMEASSDSEVPTESDSDSEDERNAEADFRAMTAVPQISDLNAATISGCVDRIIAGQALTTAKTELMTIFVKNCDLRHKQYLRLLVASEQDEMIVKFIKTNKIFAGAFLYRNAVSEQGGCELFKRYIRVTEQVESMVQASETVLKLATDFMDNNKLTPDHRDAILAYLRQTIANCENSENPPARTVRLISMLTKKLLRDHVICVDEIAPYIKPFALKFSENRECTALYKYIAEIQSGSAEGSTTSTTTNNSMTTTTTTTTSVATNSMSTTTTTTVVKQCGPAVIKQTSKKIVVQMKEVQASSLKAINSMRKSAHALFRQSTSPSKQLTSSATSSVYEVKKELKKLEKGPDDDNDPPATST